MKRQGVIPALVSGIAGVTALALASCFFLTYPLERLAKKYGWRLTGAGMIGSLAGLATVPLLPVDLWRGALFLVGALFVGVAVSDAAEKILAHHDDPRIVIDEWVGYLVSVAFLPKSLMVLLIGLVLFRLADTWKPLGINRLAKLPGGWGIVMDDVAAGLMVNLCLRVIATV